MKTFLLEVHTIVNLRVLQVNEYLVAHNSCNNVQLVGDAARDMGICKRRSFWEGFYCGCLFPSLHRPPKTLKSHQCMYDLLNSCFLKKSMTKKKAIFSISGFFCFPEARGGINVPWWP
jgi:predicted adenine nucleotide alpha hydrolase (AANH) superfamily ATPase